MGEPLPVGRDQLDVPTRRDRRLSWPIYCVCVCGILIQVAAGEPLPFGQDQLDVPTQRDRRLSLPMYCVCVIY